MPGSLSPFCHLPPNAEPSRGAASPRSFRAPAEPRRSSGRPPPPYIISFLIFSWKRIKVEFVRIVAIMLERRVVAGLGFPGELEVLRNSSLCLISASSSACLRVVMAFFLHCCPDRGTARASRAVRPAAASMPAESHSRAHFAREAYQRRALFTHITPSVFCLPLILRI